MDLGLSSANIEGRYFLGVDPSYTCTGLSALSCVGGDLHIDCVGRIETKSDERKTHIDRAIAIADKVSRWAVGYTCHKEKPVVVVESPTYGAFKSETLHALFSVLVMSLLEMGVEIVLTPSGAHKQKFVAGRLRSEGMKIPKTAPKKSGARVKTDFKQSSRELLDKLLVEDVNVLGGRGSWKHDEVEAVLLALFGVLFFNYLNGDFDRLTAEEMDIMGSEKKSNDGFPKGLVYRKNLFYHLADNVLTPNVSMKFRDFSGSMSLGG